MTKKWFFIGVGLALLFTGSVGFMPQSSSIETLSIHSKVFNNQRNLRVYLPAAYDGKRSYKVLYMNDGQDLFGWSAGGPPHEWRVDEIMDSLVHAGMEPMIIVGIDHMGKQRPNEYLPWPDAYLDPPMPHPQGKRYPEFLTTEVMPLIEQKYPVKTGRGDTGIGGASYGGLIALYTALMKPDRFGFALIESPSLYVHQQEIFTMINQQSWNWPQRVYLGIGTNEMALEDCREFNADNQMAVNDLDSLYRLIRIQSPDTQILINIDSCATHNEKAWSKRLPTALKFLMEFP